MKTTDDPKEHTIRVRVNDDMHRYLIETSNKHGSTVSEYVRDMIRRDMKGLGVTQRKDSLKHRF